MNTPLEDIQINVYSDETVACFKAQPEDCSEAIELAMADPERYARAAQWGQCSKVKPDPTTMPACNRVKAADFRATATLEHNNAKPTHRPCEGDRAHSLDL